MSLKPRIQFQHMQKSDALAAVAIKRARALERFYDSILDCDVIIAAPHHHHHKGVRYAITVKLHVPGETLVVNNESANNPAHEDCYVALHDAFRSTRRRLQDYARIRRHDVKRHETPLKRRMSELDANDDVAGEDHADG